MRVNRVVLIVFGIVPFAGCQTPKAVRAALHASIITDSTEVTVYRSGAAYGASIGFTFTNTTGKTISRAGCGGPGEPGIEKKVDGRWVAAYSPVVVPCRILPDFTWDPGARRHLVFRFGAYERGRRVLPELNVDSIGGVYRLRWTFTEGKDGAAKGARRVDAISNEFMMKLNSSTALSSSRCYRVTIGPWSVTGQGMGLVPPSEFRLDTASSTRQLARNGDRQVYPPFATERVSRFPADWTQISADSIVIRWGTGFQSGGYRLRLDGDSVKGKATTWSDARTGHPDPEAQAAGIRVPCPRDT